jgi:hypothetical protein
MQLLGNKLNVSKQGILDIEKRIETAIKERAILLKHEMLKVLWD